MPAFSLAWRPRLDSSAASPATRRSPTHPATWPAPGRFTRAQDPLVSRGGGFPLPHRYSSLHSPPGGAPGWFPPPLPPPHDAPLPTPPPGRPPRGGPAGVRRSATASAVCLSPATLSARNHLTSELLRTLSRMAASKPTSWLSLRSHILFHLAHA